MKFMKLGSKPDVFQAEGNSVRYMCSDLATDIAVRVGKVKFYLHKFPLLSKSNCMQKLVKKGSEEKSDEIQLHDFPGGAKAFEICAKFCYGITVTLNPYNVLSARCGAEYLEMTEDMDRGNLIYKIEVFFNSSIFRSWKDSIIVLQTTSSLKPWSEDLKIVGRCIDSIASKTSVDPSSVSWSYTYNRKLAVVEQISRFAEKVISVPTDWWVEDICELEIDLYKRVMIAIKSKGRMNSNAIGEALKTYANRWLPDSLEALASEVDNRKNKSLIETIIYLLPPDCCPCSFLLKLLKVAILVGADESSKEELITRISRKLDEASVNDLLIPAQSPQTTIYDFELVHCLVNRFVANEKSGRDSNVIGKGIIGDFILGRESWLNVGKLIDGYLLEAARDENLPVCSFIDMSQSIPESARPIHDGLYWAIDTYLKEHRSLTKAEKKKVCALMNVKKLTEDASMHAAQNDRLPLRVVVQVLFFEQIRASSGFQSLRNTQEAAHSITTSEEVWEMTPPEHSKSLKKHLNEIKLKEEEVSANMKLIRKGSRKVGSAMQLLPSRSRRIFDKFLNAARGNSGRENKSSETSGSSHSPVSMIPSSSRRRRHSIS